ncbi:hypothetical protein LF1_21310 [Rubripirellula obstinata]|uniref:Uncharacterized protein n=1 Tax=Rubripirellula obstinata TaxID=406547 RepID=A0A5B1CEL9_9BACT|nr:hypothetical protein LF1_21310 [Rubripirellula obstinata]
MPTRLNDLERLHGVGGILNPGGPSYESDLALIKTMPDQVRFDCLASSLGHSIDCSANGRKTAASGNYWRI